MSDELWQSSCTRVAGAARLDIGGAAIEDAVCAMWWSILVEPGDAALGYVEALCGRRDGLLALFRSTSPQEFSYRLHAHTRPMAGASSAREESRVLSAAWSRWEPRIDGALFHRAVASAESMSMAVVVPGDRWPASLDDLTVHRPACLWVRGNAAMVRAASGNSVAIVGARAATGYGEHCAMEIAGGLAHRGITVVSGGAYGIDGAAHRAALAMDGPTIAVLAGGADRLYPSGHEQLFRQIIDRGAVVSEAPPGTAPTRWRFLQRNRNIASLANATVVVEAGVRSGSLNTAHHALTLGRPLGAVPGPITSSASRGCHGLLRDAGAVCVTSVDDVCALASLDDAVVGVLPEVAGADARRGGPLGGGTDASRRPQQTRILDVLNTRKPLAVAEIARLAGMEPAAVMAVIGDLDAEGSAESRSGGWVRAG